MLFLSHSHCGSRCSVFIFTDRIYCSRARLSRGLPGWWNIRSSLETHCLSLPHWKICFCFFLGFTFPAGTALVPKSLYFKWTMFAPNVGKFTDKHRRHFQSPDMTGTGGEMRREKPLPMRPNTPQYWSESKLRVKERVGRLWMSNGHMDDWSSGS